MISQNFSLPSPPLCLASHESTPRLLIGLTSGGIVLHDIQTHNNKLYNNPLKSVITHPLQHSCQTISFTNQPNHFVAGVTNGTVLCFDENEKQALHTYKLEKAEDDNQTNASYVGCLEENLMIVGDDNGGLHLLDVRQPNHFATSALDHGDYISQVIPVEEYGTKALLVGSGDGTLSAYDMRKPPKARLQLQYASDCFDDDLLCLTVVPSAGLAVAGTVSGALNLYNLRLLDKEYDAETAAHVDRFYGHPECVNSILSHDDEGIVMTGSSDGIIRVVDVVKKCLLGVLPYDGRSYDGRSYDFNDEGESKGKKRKRKKRDRGGGWPVECIVKVGGVERTELGLLGHDEMIRFCDASILDEDDDDDNDDDDNDDDDDDDNKGTRSNVKGSMSKLINLDQETEDKTRNNKNSKASGKKSKRVDSCLSDEKCDFFDGL